MPRKTTPRRYGMHTSIAGGLHLALERAADAGCSALQIFSRNPRGWSARPLSEEDAARFRETRSRLRLDPVVVHDNYLINLAALEEPVRGRSIEAFRDEIVRAAQIGADYLVTHPGSAKGGTAAEGVRMCIEAIREACDGLELGGVTILIENTAGQGACIGRSFEEVAAIVDGCERELPMGACLDTAHTFAAGYDLASAEGFGRVMAQLDETVGFGRVRAIHFNDSKAAFASNVDRHEHIGEGAIGFDPLERVARFEPLWHAPLILETPVDERHDDRWNLEQIRRMLGDGAASHPS